MSNIVRSTHVSFTPVGNYAIESRVGRSFKQIIEEYPSLEISFLMTAMRCTGTTKDALIAQHHPTMSIVRLETANATTRDLHYALKASGQRAIGWTGVFIFGAQQPEASLKHRPIAIGGRPFIAYIGGDTRHPKRREADYMQVRKEHEGHRETDLELQVACTDDKTGFWRMGENFLVTDLKR